MSVATPQNPGSSATSTLSLRHAFMIYTSPRALFSRVEDTGTYGWALATLLLLVTGLGFLEVKTGLIDRTVDIKTELSLATMEKNQADLIDRVELRDRMDDVRKAGEFNKMLARLGVVVVKPVYLLVSMLLISSVFYALVAMTGRKPEYHTLMSICVYSAFIVLVGYVVRLAMVIAYRTSAVETSLAMLAPPGQGTPLAGIDVFRIWFWVLLASGLIITRQVGRRMAIVSCSVLALSAAGVRIALSYAMTT